MKTSLNGQNNRKTGNGHFHFLSAVLQLPLKAQSSKQDGGLSKCWCQRTSVSRNLPRGVAVSNYSFYNYNYRPRSVVPTHRPQPNAASSNLARHRTRPSAHVCMTWAASVRPRLLSRAAWPLRSLVRILMPVIMSHVALVRLLALVHLVTLIRLLV